MASNFNQIGVSGLEHYSGYVHEEWLRQLQGDRGRRAFREMADNDPVVGAILFAVEMLLRNVEWRVDPWDDTPDRRADAEFVESLLEDMSHTWEDFVAEALTMLPHGWALHEIVYKRRLGPDQRDPARRSKFDDGRVGWRKLAPRAQTTLDRWELDDDGGIKGMWQLPPNGGAVVLIPIEKALLFRTTSRKSNPEGRSILRNAYSAWYYKKRTQEIEAIGVERDLAGMPIFTCPSTWFGDAATTEEKAALAELKNVVQKIKQDDQAGLIIPAMYDSEGNQIFKFELAGTGARRLFDTSAIVERYTKEIAMTVLADFILLGHEKVGSFALSSDKTEVFGTALGAWLKEIASVLNRHALPRLYQLNGLDAREPAQLVPGDVEKEDVERFAQGVMNLTNAGWLTPGSEGDEEHVRQVLGLPPVPDDRDDLIDERNSLAEAFDQDDPSMEDDDAE